MFNNHRMIYVLLAIALLPLAYTAMIGTSPQDDVGRLRSHKNLRNAVANELIVSYRSGTTFSAQSQMMGRHGLTVKHTLGSGHSVMKVAASKPIETVIQEMSADPAVASVQPNYLYHAYAVPNDPSYAQEWGFKNSGQTVTNAGITKNNPGTSGSDMNLESAWDVITDCKSVTVAVLDTGVNYTHQDLAANMWDGGGMYPNHGYNFVDKNNDPRDLNGHGTHVAGTIGAAGNNGVGTVGVCWKATIMAARALDASGTGNTADIVDAIKFAADNGAKVINMSLGTSENDPLMEAAVKYAQGKGVLLVVAAGNDAADNDDPKLVQYPCGYKLDNVLCVAALDQAYSLASYSNFGATTVHVGAPGTNVLSSTAGQETVVSDLFNTGGALNWPVTGGTAPNTWGYKKVNLNVGGVSTPFDMMTIPTTWNRTAKYAANTVSSVAKTFNLMGADSALLDVELFLDVAATDLLRIAFNTAGSPFAATGTVLDEGTGSSQGTAFPVTYDLSGCRVATCSIGFRLTSANGTDFGIALFDLTLTTMKVAPNFYRVLSGTSMATPHAAGLATMLFAQNPNYTYLDVANALKKSGRDVTGLAGKTTTGKAIDASAAVKYIIPPASITFEPN